MYPSRVEASGTTTRQPPEFAYENGIDTLSRICAISSTFGLESTTYRFFQKPVGMSPGGRSVILADITAYMQ